MQTRPALNSRDQPASASKMLGLKVCDTNIFWTCYIVIWPQVYGDQKVECSDLNESGSPQVYVWVCEYLYVIRKEKVWSCWRMGGRLWLLRRLKLFWFAFSNACVSRSKLSATTPLLQACLLLPRLPQWWSWALKLKPPKTQVVFIKVSSRSNRKVIKTLTQTLYYKDNRVFSVREFYRMLYKKCYKQVVSKLFTTRITFFFLNTQTINVFNIV